jgi:hypothetical protein
MRLAFSKYRHTLALVTNWLSNRKKGGEHSPPFFVVSSNPAALFSCRLIPVLRGIDLCLCVRLLRGFMISLALVMFS